MQVIPQFRGPFEYRARCSAMAAGTVLKTVAHRLRHGPRMPGWNWTVELGTAIIRNHLRTAFALHEVTEMRRYLDALVLAPQWKHRLVTKDIAEESFRGTWFLPPDPLPITLLYLHGGGFAFYPRDSYANFIALVALAANARTFALDYRLAPEYRFPAQLDDVRAGYLRLLDDGIPAQQIVVAGDSAGGQLTIALLCDLRDRRLPPPALGIALSPATEFDTIRPSMHGNKESDWISGEMALAWRDWFCAPEQRADPLVSPIHANLRGLPPIYIQAGRAEILYDSIASFAAEALRQGADVTLESWPGMNHVFQCFGYDAPQSAAALGRIGAVVADRVAERV
jgi:epsilon-lactone hydrolase